MSDLPWFRFFPSDWLGGTRGMSAAETGIYITLIATMYERGAPVPEEIARLARLCGASNSAFKTALETLAAEGKIIRVEGGLWNERVGKETEIRAEKSEVGRSAAQARWAQKDNKNNATNDANAMPSQSERNANQKPETREETKPTVSQRRRGTRWPSGQAVPNDWLRWGESNFPSIEPQKIAAEARKFTDYWPGQPNGVKLEWEPTWRNWLRKAFPGCEADGKSAAASPDLVTLPADHPDILAIERLRGKPVIVGNSGRVTVSRAEIALAKREPDLLATGPP